MSSAAKVLGARLTPEREAICKDIQALEDRAMRAGMPITSRGLNQAKNGWGWEVAGDISNAANAIIGKRPGEST